MLGWELPPYFAGGVGTVCYELTRGLASKGVEVTYVMPRGPKDAQSPHVRLLIADGSMEHITLHRVGSLIMPYISKEQYGFHYRSIMGKEIGRLYGEDLLAEMARFAHEVLRIARQEEFDVIHAHDWTTIPAAIALKDATGKPLIVHVHITEFDKSGGEHADPEIYRIEHEGFMRADRVIAVSNFVKRRLVERYSVPEWKIRIVHNAVEGRHELATHRERLNPDERLILFLGRVTLQKGPDYFLEAAAKVANAMPDVKFIMAGTGDMLPRMIERAADLGLANKVMFTGFVTREQGDRLYRMADLFVMPSVSEPFGIVPLEAMRQGTPVIISRQSGVSEVIRHALKVDFWNVEDLANKMIAALSYPVLHETMREHTTLEISTFTWETPAEHCRQIYDELTGAIAW